MISKNQNDQVINQLKSLHKQMMSKQESERHQISTYINDTAIQSLSALHIQLSLFFTKLPSLTQEELTEALALIVDLIEGLRLVARQLRPFELNTLGLNESIKQLCEEYRQETQLNICYDGIDIPILDETTIVAFFRLAQEALANVIQHSHATQVWVVLQSDGNSVSLKIEDNGRGFEGEREIDEPVNAPGLVLFGLMIWFENMNGRILIHSNPGVGTTVTGILPLESPVNHPILTTFGSS